VRLCLDPASQADCRDSDRPVKADVRHATVVDHLLDFGGADGESSRRLGHGQEQAFKARGLL